jgi:hypothetical protein
LFCMRIDHYFASAEKTALAALLEVDVLFSF